MRSLALAPLAALGLFLSLAPGLAVLLLGARGLPLLSTDPFWLYAARDSLAVSSKALACAWPLGAAAALGIWGAAPQPRRLVLSLAVVALILPPSWAGAGFRALAAQTGMGEGAVLVTAHAGRAAGLVTLVMTGFLNGVDPRIGRAAGLTGALPSRIWILVALPNLYWPVLASGAAAAALCVGDAALDGWIGARTPMLDVLVAQAARLNGGATAPAALLLVIVAGLPLLVFGLGAMLRRAWRR